MSVSNVCTLSVCSYKLTCANVERFPDTSRMNKKLHNIFCHFFGI